MTPSSCVSLFIVCRGGCRPQALNLIGALAGFFDLEGGIMGFTFRLGSITEMEGEISNALLFCTFLYIFKRVLRQI